MRSIEEEAASELETERAQAAEQVPSPASVHTRAACARNPVGAAHWGAVGAAAKHVHARIPSDIGIL